MAKESALFVHDERPEQISVDIREEVEASSEHVDVDDNEDYDEGFEDEDYDN